MNKSSTGKRRSAKTRKDRQGNQAAPILRVKKGASLKEIYAAARRAFTAADLQKYTEIEAGIPARQVLAELEAVDREEARRLGARAKRGSRKKFLQSLAKVSNA